MSNDLRLRVLMNLVENVTRPLRNMTAGSTQAAGALRATRDRLRQLNDAQRDVGAFRQMRSAMSATTAEAAQARQRVADLARQLHANGPPTQAMVRDFNRARQAARELAEAQRNQAIRLAEMRTRLRSAGIDTRNLSQHERDLRNNLRTTTAEMERQQRVLAELAEVADDVVVIADGRVRFSGTLESARAGYATFEDAFFHLADQGPDGAPPARQAGAAS